MKILTLLLASIVSFQVHAQTLVESDALHPEYAHQALDVLRTSGFDAYLRYWRENSETALDLRAWCRDQKAANGGPVSYDFATHESGVEIVEALNLVNAEMGFDCYKVSAKVDNENFRDIKTPSPVKQKLYNRARKIRSALIPLLGFLITAGPMGKAISESGLGQAFAHHGAEFMKANMKAFLEFQFAYFTALWSIPFGQKIFPELKVQAQNYFKQVVKTLSLPLAWTARGLNKLLDKSGGRVKAAHFWISAVNLAMYPFMMGVAAYLGNHLVGPDNYQGLLDTLLGSTASGLNFVRDQFAMSAAFNFNFMFFQERSNAARNLAMSDELGRSMLEAGASLVCNAFRGISAIYPQLQMPMVVAQMAVGGSLSYVMTSKVMGAYSFARESGRRFADLEAQKDVAFDQADGDLLAQAASVLEGSVVDSQASTGFMAKMKASLSHACELAFHLPQNSSAWIFEKLKLGFHTDSLMPKGL